VDKKIHKHYKNDEGEHRTATLFKKKKLHELEEELLNDIEDDDLKLDLMHFLKQ